MSLSPIPRETPIVASERDPVSGRSQLTGLLGFAWDQWLRELTTRVEVSPQRAVTIALTAQAASIAPTSLALPSTSSGLYRVTVYARITRAATTSSSLTLTVGHTDGGVSCSQSGAAITGNTTATVQSVSFLVKRDASTPLTYSTTYASVGGTTMLYALSVVVEAVS